MRCLVILRKLPSKPGKDSLCSLSAITVSNIIFQNDTGSSRYKGAYHIHRSVINKDYITKSCVIDHV